MEENEILSQDSIEKKEGATAHETDTDKTAGSLYTFAKIISAVFSPFLVPFIAFVILFFFTYLNIMPPAYKLTVLVMVACFTILLPSIGIYLLQRINGWGMHGLTQRENRFLPYGMTMLSYIACLLTMYNMHLPQYMCGIIISVLICMTLCLAINIKWKISVHTAGCGILVGGLCSFSMLFFFNPSIWLSIFILISGLVASARIIVRQHTLGEVTAGFLVGLICGITGILYIYP